METLEITEHSILKLEKVAGRLRAIAHPVRLAIIDMLTKSTRMSVTEIYLKLDIEQAAASHHLNIMKNKSILEARRDGKKIYYSLRNKTLSDIISCIDQCKDC